MVLPLKSNLFGESLNSTTSFLQFTKQKFEYYFHVNFSTPLLGLLGVRGLKF